MSKLSGLIITYNEERNIKDCIESMLPVVDELIVVDSFSTDKTAEICSNYDVKFITNKFEGHIEQKNFAVEQATYDFVLSLDADERISKEMAASILQEKEAGWNNQAYAFNRLNNYCGKWLRHSWYPDRKVRLWNKNSGKWGGTNPHDRVVLKNAKPKKLSGDLHHYAYQSVDEHLIQIQKFAGIAAEAKYREGRKVNFFIHVLLSPLFKFFRKYILNFGFLDGYYGFIYCYMAAYLNFMKYTNLWEKQKIK